MAEQQIQLPAGADKQVVEAIAVDIARAGHAGERADARHIQHIPLRGGCRPGERQRCAERRAAPKDQEGAVGVGIADQDIGKTIAVYITSRYDLRT